MGNTDALSTPRPSSSLAPAPDYELIAHGEEQAARLEIAKALKTLTDALNTYISRKGV